MRLYDLKNMTYQEAVSSFYKQRRSGKIKRAECTEIANVLAYVDTQAVLELGWRSIFKEKRNLKKEEIWARVWGEIEEDFKRIEELAEKYKNKGAKENE